MTAPSEPIEKGHQGDDGRWYCNRCEEHYPTRLILGAHYRKHLNADRRDSGDTSDVPMGSEPEKVEPDGVFDPPWIPGPKPKVAAGLVPWLSMMGLAVSQRNAYDGAVITQGIPPLIEALDDVAQDNAQLYKLLDGINKSDSPTFKLVVASMAIVVPILANHRPDSGMLRNLTGALRFVPSTNIPKMPARPDHEDEDNRSAQMMGLAADFVANMSEEQQEQMAAQMADVPPDVMAQMMAQAAPIFGGMAHPETLDETLNGSADIGVNETADNGSPDA